MKFKCIMDDSDVVYGPINLENLYPGSSSQNAVVIAACF